MGSHSYLQNLCSGSACNQMNTGYLMNLGDTTLDNYRSEGLANFNNLYGHGNTRIGNLIGTAGSQQNFGLQQLDTMIPFYLVKDSANVYHIVQENLTLLQAQEAGAILIPPMPESDPARPWTQYSWNQWNLLANNGTAHPDRPFSQIFGFEPFL